MPSKRSSKKSPEKKGPKKSPKKVSPKSFKVLLANRYQGQDPVGLYISEKLDGIRAIFYNGKFYSRNNNPIYAPDWFLEEINSKVAKNTLLDGELFTTRGDFDKISSIVRKKDPVDSEWRKITYMVFDIPNVKEPFASRYTSMQKLLKGVPHVKVVKQTLIKSVSQFDKIHKDLVRKGAEGTMLRDPDSYYENKRSNTLLKVKDFLDDEVIVDSVEYGEGKHSDKMGNLIVHWAPHSKKKYKGTFKVGTGFTDNERKQWRSKFKKGTKLTIKYFELTKSGVPRFPIYMNIYHKQ